MAILKRAVVPAVIVLLLVAGLLAGRGIANRL